MPPVVDIEHLSMRFGRRTVLNDVSLALQAGEVIGFAGPNGGGKSTLMTCIAGLVRPTMGTVRVEGTHAHDIALERGGTIGLITAEPGLYPLLTGRENLTFFGRLYGLTPSETAARVDGLIARLGLSELLDVRSAAYSSGMKQKVSLARALLMRPKVLLLDEPTANLDPISARTIVATVREHADEGNTCVWVTHDLPLAEQICDRVAYISGGLVHLEAIAGDRRVPPPSRLLSIWQDVLGDP